MERRISKRMNYPFDNYKNKKCETCYYQRRCAKDKATMHFCAMTNSYRNQEIQINDFREQVGLFPIDLKTIELKKKAKKLKKDLQITDEDVNPTWVKYFEILAEIRGREERSKELADVPTEIGMIMYMISKENADTPEVAEFQTKLLNILHKYSNLPRV